MKKLIAILLALALVLGIASCALAVIDVTGEVEEESMVVQTENEDEEEDEEPLYTTVPLYDDKNNEIGYETYYGGILVSKSIKDGNKTTHTYYENGQVSSTSVQTFNDKGQIISSEQYDSKNQLTYVGKFDEDNKLYTSNNYENGQLVFTNVWGEDENGYYDLSFKPDGSIYEESPWGNSTSTAYYNNDDQKWYSWETGEEVKAPNLDSYLAKARKMLVGPITWYPNNSVSVVGISLRNAYPELTKKWYHVLPVDLSQDGTQIFPIVAGNMYYIGTVSVTVAGDDVTTTYSYHARNDYHIYPQDECLAWFTGINQITGEFLESPASDMAFGKAISKSKDLNGQDAALLFICNHLTFRVPFNNKGVTPSRFWPNSNLLKDYYAGVNAVMEKLGK